LFSKSALILWGTLVSFLSNNRTKLSLPSNLYGEKDGTNRNDYVLKSKFDISTSSLPFSEVNKFEKDEGDMTE
jgi:hypothetical protein